MALLCKESWVVLPAMAAVEAWVAYRDSGRQGDTSPHDAEGGLALLCSGDGLPSRAAVAHADAGF